MDGRDFCGGVKVRGHRREEEEQMSMGNEDQEGNSDFGAEKNERYLDRNDGGAWVMAEGNKARY